MLSAQRAAASRAPTVQCATQASNAGPPVQPALANAQHQAAKAQQAQSGTSRSLTGALSSRSQSRSLQVAASPVYVSRSERQSMSASQGGVVNQRRPHVPPSLTASPVISEMIYSLPGTPMSQSWLAGRGLSRNSFDPAQDGAGSSSSAGGALPDAVPVRGRMQLAYTTAGEAGLPGRPGSSEATVAASARDMSPGCLPAGQANRPLEHEQDPRAQAQHADGMQLRGADTAVPLSKTPDISFTLREIDEQPIEHDGRARFAAEFQQNLYPSAESEAQPGVLSRRQTDSSYVSCDDGECQGGPEGTLLDYSGFSSDMRAQAKATAESLFRQAEASTAGNSAERSSHPDSGGIQQGAACLYVGSAEPLRASIHCYAPVVVPSFCKCHCLWIADMGSMYHVEWQTWPVAGDTGTYVQVLTCSHLTAGGASMGGSPEELSVGELEEHIRALQLEIAESDAARAAMRKRMRVKHAEQDVGKPYGQARSSLLSLDSSAVTGADASGASQSDKACNIGWTMSPEMEAAEVL